MLTTLFLARHSRWPLSFLFVVGLAATALAAVPISPEAESLVLRQIVVHEEKSVFATVESRRVVPARVRISGTVAELRVVEGDQVEGGQTIGHVGDEKLALQILSLESRITGLRAQREQAETDRQRLEQLLPSGAVSQSSLDNARTAFKVADNALQSVVAERNVIRRQLSEGAVLAPVSGRILEVPITAGAVVMPGEIMAMVAEENYILRLQIPERHARLMQVDDPVHIDSEEIGKGIARAGRISKIYPHISDGRVLADAQVEGLGNYFVGQRIRVWIPAGQRPALVVPARFITTRGGIDFVLVQEEDGTTSEVAVQRGQVLDLGVEILSGLTEGDNLRLPLP